MPCVMLCSALLQLYKDNGRPAWWPLPTFDGKQLKTRAAMDSIYSALRSRFGEPQVCCLLERGRLRGASTIHPLSTATNIPA